MDKSKQKIYFAVTAVLMAGVGVELGFMSDAFATWLYVLLWVAFACVAAMLAVGLAKQIDSLTKLAAVAAFCAIVLLSAYLAMFKSGFLEKFDTAEEIAEYISDSPLGIFLFILISFLQVTFIPIPSTITTVTGTLVFGPTIGMIYSLIGQVAGSMLAFWLGKKFGSRLAKWIAGEELYEKYNKFVKGRDKIILGYMLLFPFFPDDVICLFFGLTNATYLGFFVLITVSRVITIGYTSYLTEMISKIPLTPAGFCIYGLIALVIIGMLILCWKKGEWLELQMTKIIQKVMPKKLKEKRARDLAEAETEAAGENVASCETSDETDNDISADTSDGSHLDSNVTSESAKDAEKPSAGTSDNV